LSSDDLFAAIFLPDEAREAVSGRAWLAAMLAAERALTVVSARAGIVPAEAAEAIVAACVPSRYDPEEIAREGRAAGNPVEPLVRALRTEVGGEAAQWVHFGATSQDILDTAAMRVAQRGIELVRLHSVAERCAELARRYRDTPMAARTLLQQAVPTTFGAKAAGWLLGVAFAEEEFSGLEPLPAQLGGAAGTLALFRDRGPELADAFAEEVDLHAPAAPWHSNRVPVARVGAALDLAAGAVAKIALDVMLLAQPEIAEVRVGNGASSTMPHKRNPVDAVIVVACARQVHAHASVLTGGMAQEHERAAGAWHAEWPALNGALAYAAGASAAAVRLLDRLKVDVERMRANILDETLSESEKLGERAAAPEDYLGSAGAFVDRALERYRLEFDSW
jgi:3-carboxy-cis,cis-muconate cycloisomerase